MKSFKFFLHFILFLLLFSCKDNNSTEPSLPPTSGRVTIDSKVEGNKFEGFYFSRGEVLTYPNSQNISPDLMVLGQTNEEGGIIGVYFSAGEFRPSFYLVNWPSTADSAQMLFETLTEIPDTTFQELAIPVRAKQIWALKTREDKFAKILILETSAYIDSSDSSAPTPYGESTFDWVFQPNGSRQF